MGANPTDRRVAVAQVPLLRRTDYRRIASSRKRHADRRDRPQARHLRSDVLCVRKRFGSLGTPEIRELRQLREENSRLKRLVADLTLDRQILQDVVKKSGEKGAAHRHAATSQRALAVE